MRIRRCVFLPNKNASTQMQDIAWERMVARAAPLHAHAKSKNEDRVKNDICHRADEYRQHSGSCKPLGCDKHVHT